MEEKGERRREKGSGGGEGMMPYYMAKNPYPTKGK